MSDLLKPSEAYQEILTTTALKGFERAMKSHLQLGRLAFDEMENPNLFGEPTMIGDWDAEEQILAILADAKLPIRAVTEEHGEVNLTTNPSLLAVIDGLDGAYFHKTDPSQRYGTMFGIFSSLDPTYNDFLFSGILIPNERKILFAAPGKGSWLIANGKKIPLHCSPKSTLDPNTRIRVDTNFDGAFNVKINEDAFISKLRKGHLPFSSARSTAIHYEELAKGSTDLVLECTRKNNLEPASAFGLITGAGGVIVTVDGESLGDKKYFEFGQRSFIPIIGAANQELANNTITFLNKVA